jgi:hypothetical protein
VIKSSHETACVEGGFHVVDRNPRLVGAALSIGRRLTMFGERGWVAAFKAQLSHDARHWLCSLFSAFPTREHLSNINPRSSPAQIRCAGERRVAAGPSLPSPCCRQCARPSAGHVMPVPRRSIAVTSEPPGAPDASRGRPTACMRTSH